ncbi:MAG TPA: hypothetical protein VKA48_07470, partial [Gammaproteobacteria bacterium]|nr:hypothetical protein [Gammaproteobacteria bacterium]
LWGLLVAVGTALLFIVLWPVRRLRRRLKNKGDGEAKVSEGSSEESSQPGTSERDPVETEQHGK